ncbi:phosphoribosylglycinamide formyltransferase [Vibrio sp. vnigr-6D03]|uniref:RelA/SpoT domain-containing protein n=1 Tax=Vibrio sp. vnigr-6D03 TaxID=2058088 RepID=UPI000C31C990|nr:RelA/SpoT domain-containing protein [Vibrio sp. vnigr-6D03]PKF76715.1 phosphoribosylglycinamide formyltransferase [Vibrio sp. vnigr-6D03]
MNLFLKTTALMLLLLSKAPFAAVNSPTYNSDSARSSGTSQNQPNANVFRRSLSGLYSIPSTNAKPIQPYSDFDVLYSKAHQAQFELENLCKTAGMLSGTTPYFAGVKSESRAKDKIEKELDGNVSRITDLARATLVAKDIPSLVTAYEMLHKNAKILKVKNRFKSPTPSGYRDLNVLLELPGTKLIAEVQLHLSDIAEVKSGAEHKIYQKIQFIERTAAIESREMNDIEIQNIKQLRSKAKTLYQNAWQPYIAPQAA